MRALVCVCCAFLLLISCKKKEVVLSDNTIPYYDEVPSIVLQNYVNRVFIDLIGREPTNDEMTLFTQQLRADNLSASVRANFVDTLMLSTKVIPGDGSYKEAYFRKLYEDHKGRFLEGASENDLNETYFLYRTLATQDSLQGNMLGYQLFTVEAEKMKNVITSRVELQNQTITIDEMCRRMMNNAEYDAINMNTFNFINASFDACYFRFPTEFEMQSVYNSVESSIPGSLFGYPISNKSDYLTVLTSANEFKEGLIRWVYKSFLLREPTTNEAYSLMDDVGASYNVSLIQKNVLISNEYAGFE